MNRRLCLLAIVALLAGCGGGSSEPSAPVSIALPWAMVQPSDRVMLDPGYSLQIQPLSELDPATSVLAQSKLPGNVILWAGFTKGAGFSTFPAFVEQAKKYPKITHAYIYDELFWSLQAKTVIGLDEVAVLQAAKVAHDAGLKTVVTILPGVILDPAFRLADINAFDVIAIDVYPSSRPHDASQLGSCKYNDNLYSNLLFCSIQKLRAMGFRGDAWHIFQSFGVHTETDALLREHLTLQRETIRDAEKIGAAGLVPFGLYLSAETIANEPFLYQLAGTPLESLVRP